MREIVGSASSATSPSDLGRSSAAAEPRDHDLVVRQEPDRGGRFGVGEFPGTAQFFSPTCEEAVRIAEGYARRHQIDVWYANGQGYTRLARFRTPDGRRGPGLALRTE